MAALYLLIHLGRITQLASPDAVLKMLATPMTVATAHVIVIRPHVIMRFMTK
jgi:hypothetical protein